MALSHKAKKRWSLFILLLALPIYILFAAVAMEATWEWSMWLRLPLYILLGFAWVFPFKSVFLGVGQADPNAPPPNLHGFEE